MDFEFLPNFVVWEFNPGERVALQDLCMNGHEEYVLNNSVKKNLQYVKSKSIAGYAALITAASFWGASGVFVKLIIAQENMSATALAFWRDFATFICLLFFGLVTIPRRLWIRRSDWPYMAGMGASLGLFHIFYNLSVILNGAAVTTVQQALMPAIVTVAAWYIWREEFTSRKMTAILLALAGAVLVAGPAEIKSSGFTFHGLLIGFLVPCFYAGWNLFGKKVRMQYDALVVLIFAFGIASLMLLPLQFFIHQPWPIKSTTWIWFAGLIGLCTLSAFFLYAV